MDVKAVAGYLVRFVICFMTMEFILHYMYVVAIKDVRAWVGDTPSQVAMIGFWNLIIVWLKVLSTRSHFRNVLTTFPSYSSLGDSSGFGRSWTELTLRKTWFDVWQTTIPPLDFGEVGTEVTISGLSGKWRRQSGQPQPSILTNSQIHLCSTWRIHIRDTQYPPRFLVRGSLARLVFPSARLGVAYISFRGARISGLLPSSSPDLR